MRSSEANLGNAQYKVWLVETYGITKNEVLGEFVCGEKSFKSIDDALQFAHSEETEKRARMEEERSRREAEHLAEIERLVQKQAIDDARNRRLGKWLLISLAAASLIASPFIYQSFSDAAEMDKAREAAKEARASEILSELGLAMNEMASVDVRPTNSPSYCDGEKGVLYTFHTTEDVIQAVRQKISDSGHQLLFKNEGYVAGYIVSATLFYDNYFTVCDIAAEIQVQ